ncbi:hypothetical protein [Halalkalicoccus sp. NIPERK01]|uniref:hypothetical protein n=1 Tax=Halalkalicoccus sp. NIPERK01 TaxID=3053469 RepID=UPI00256F3345|nr:hypothetical protein [Halalkalicoccus sp. NIPERK01]MDL5362669.1 hypothetical protein [Halalkalicoccus sp. NIPERK01]
MTDSNDRGYVYEPGVEPATSPDEREFDWRGWTLVGVIVFAFLVAPAVILFHPPDALPFFVAYLVLPLLPAVLLGFVAVWSTTR